MAFQVIPEKYLADFPKETIKERVKESAVVAAARVGSGAAGLFDFIIALVAAFWYYFFTGLALVVGRTLPSQWLRLGTHFGMVGVKARIKKVAPVASGGVSALKDLTKKTFKVVDIDTKRPMRVLKTAR